MSCGVLVLTASAGAGRSFFDSLFAAAAAASCYNVVTLLFGYSSKALPVDQKLSDVPPVRWERCCCAVLCALGACDRRGVGSH